ncbi:hypothetical protein LTR62_004823 [Meristemomyces frigidus]|uniref:N-acetyltransferase domain-containing protein n=1 Tax=Meristemomyces frigidus TaxID=1508187 RepID=A0AAN7YFP6_9PEZI|nr:hypothetical protein LTR62_004823 [Meristemomyces frigidus]
MVNTVTYRDALPEDVESMSTMVPRSYDDSAFLPQVIPDTPATRQWWIDTYRHALSDPAARLLIAVDNSTKASVGILTLHYLGPDSSFGTHGGITSAIPLTPDHSLLLAEGLTELKTERKELMGEDPHYLIELVGVDRRFQGQGIGKTLTAMACEIADRRDAAIYLQTSAAKEYYVEKLGMGFVAQANGDDRSGTIIRAQKSARRST